MFILNGSLAEMRGKKLFVKFALGVIERHESEELGGFRIACEETFIKDLKWADSIYFGPGDTIRAMEVLKQFDVEQIKKILKNKIVIGSSAGVSILTAHSANFDHMIFMDGMGVLPYSSIVHYDDYKSPVIDQLITRYGLPVLCIRDGDCVRISL